MFIFLTGNPRPSGRGGFTLVRAVSELQQRAHSLQVLPDGSASRAAGNFNNDKNFRKNPQKAPSLSFRTSKSPKLSKNGFILVKFITGGYSQKCGIKLALLQIRGIIS